MHLKEKLDKIYFFYLFKKMPIPTFMNTFFAWIFTSDAARTMAVLSYFPGFVILVIVACALGKSLR
jgi:hypothetical protein